MKTSEKNLTPKEVLPNLYHIEHADPGAERMGISTNTYVLVKEDKALVIDALFDYLFDPIKEILADRITLSGVVLTHRHLLNSLSFLETLHAEYDVPVFMHPEDLKNSRAGQLPFSFQDPMDRPMLQEFGLEAHLFPGHTEGSIILYHEPNGGSIIAGDAAMGSTHKQLEEGNRDLVRVPAKLSVDDGQTKENWESFDLPFANCFPLHGGITVDRADERERFLKSLRRPQPTVM